MPRRDGTGPNGEGPLTGRGFGPCGSGYNQRSGRGRGRGFGYGYSFFDKTQKEIKNKEDESVQNKLTDTISQ